MKIYQNILQKIPTPILIIDATGKIMLANNATFNLFPVLRDNIKKVNINSLFNKGTTDYILSLLKLDETINASTVSFETAEEKFTIQVEQFELNDKIKGGILILS